MKTPENQIIQRFRSIGRAVHGSGQIKAGIGDDAALFSPRAAHETILTCDWFLEDTHFVQRAHPPDAVGWKCLARALSDIAAMGGRPKCFLLSLALSQASTGPWLSGFLQALRRAAHIFRCPLVGGDTTRSRSTLISITAIGEVRRARAVLRSTARPRDLVFVSGTLGLAALGLRILEAGVRRSSRDVALKKHLYPEPRLALGEWLSAQGLASAMIDVSDGLSTDLGRLCAASHVGARIEAARIPMPTVRQVRLPKGHATQANPLELALNGGDDYELLFTVRPRKAGLVPSSFRRIPLTQIGEITSGQKLQLALRDGRNVALRPRGWDPFRQR